MSDVNGKSLSFLELFQGHRRGALVARCGEQMDKLVEAMAEVSDGGSMTIKMNFKFNKAGQLEMTPSVSISPPKAPVGVGILYVDPNNRLTRQDPNQMTLDDELERRRERS